MSASAESVGVTVGDRAALRPREDAVLWFAGADKHRRLVEGLQSAGWTLEIVDDPQAAVERARGAAFLAGVVALDGEDAVGWCERLCGHPDATEMEWTALLEEALLEAPAVRDFIVSHCFDYHLLPADARSLAHSLGHAQGMGRLIRDARWGAAGGLASAETCFVAESAAMKRVLRNVERVARSELPVLIGGESGSGKEEVALALHARSRRASGPFVAVNCAALAPSLMHAELFGHEKGAFTGAHRRRIGRIESAAGGTILLDEVGDLPPSVQVSLLRFLEERTIERVGASETFEVDARVVAATHVDLEAAVSRGDFREDLYYRLNVLSVEVPPLRERPEDSVALATLFLEQQRAHGNVRACGFSEGAMRAMLQHDWPGNVRELRNRVSQAAVMCASRLVSRDDLGLERRKEPRYVSSLQAARDAAERQAIMASLEWADGNVTQAAKVLGVSRVHLYKLLERHRIDSNGRG